MDSNVALPDEDEVKSLSQRPSPPPAPRPVRPFLTRARAGFPVAVLDSGVSIPHLAHALRSIWPEPVDSIEVRVSGRVIAELDGFFSDGARLVAGAVGDDGLLKVREAAVSAHVEKALAAEKPTPVLLQNSKGRGPFKRDVAAGGLGWLTRVAQEGDGEQLDIVINGVACRVKCTNSFEAVHVSSFERGAFYTFAALMGFLVMANLR